MYQLMSQSLLSGAMPASAGRRRLVVQAGDAPGAGSGTVNKPMPPPSMNQPPAPQPQLSPLPQTQSPQPMAPPMPRPPNSMTNSNGRPPQPPPQMSPGGMNRPMSQPGMVKPMAPSSTTIPLAKPPMQQSGNAGSAFTTAPAQQPQQPQQPRQGMPPLPPNPNAVTPPQMQRPTMAPPAAPSQGVRPPALPPQPTQQQLQMQRPIMAPPGAPSSAGTAAIPQQQQQQQMQRPIMAPPSAGTAAVPPQTQQQQMQRPGMTPPGAGVSAVPPQPQQQQQQQMQRPIMAPPSAGTAAVSPQSQQQQMQRPIMAPPGAGAAAPPSLQQPIRPPGQGMAPPPSIGLQRPPPAAAPTAAGSQGPGLLSKPSMPMQPPPGPSAAAAAPPPPGLAPRPMMPPGGGPPPRPGQIGLSRPVMTPPSVPLQRPAPPQVEIKRPEMPQAATVTRTEISLTRPVIPAAPEQQQGAAAQTAEQRRATGRLGSIEIIEEDDDDHVADEDEEEEKGKKGKKGKGKGKKEKVTAEMKRAARKQREQERDEKAAAQRREREEIFEVGEEGMSLEALAEAIQVDPSDIMRTLFMKGIMLSMNQVLDKNTCKLVATEYDLLVVDKEETSVTAGAVKQREFLELDDLDDAQPRPPVVTVMGHVDHGKTSLLDFIRKAKVAAGEAGGITQAIGAYNVDVEVDGDKKTICFLDTPGHEAFSAMRARGARVTDLAIIIVAADDGVQPQTREAVSHAQAAEVPIVVAINKIDKPGADVERAKQGLLELNLVPEEWGGSTPMVPVSAKKGTGIDDLLQTVCWVAEERQLMANANKLAAGTVIEAHLDKKRGPVATLLVQAGTLKVGDIVSCGASYGKVRTLSNAAGSSIKEAGPSIAVQLVGLNAVPQAGDEFQAHASESDARSMALEAQEGLRAQRIAEMSTTGSMVTLSSLATMDEDVDTLQRMNLIIKGDTSGVVEAIKGALQSLPQESVVLRYLLCAAGDITISDVDLAAASTGMVVGFNLNPDEAVLSHAKRLGVTINTYKVIYNLIDDVKAAMEGKLRQVEERLLLGSATVKAVFGSGKKKVAGCLVDDGKLQKGAMVEVTRGKQGVVFTGKLASLRRIKDNVDEVQSGLECGVGSEDWTSWQEGDVISCYMTVTKSQRLEEAKAATAVDVASL